MSIRKQDLRFAQYVSQTAVFVNGKTLYRFGVDPAAYPKMLPTAIKNEKKPLDILIFLWSCLDRSAKNALLGSYIHKKQINYIILLTYV